MRGDVTLGKYSLVTVDTSDVFTDLYLQPSVVTWVGLIEKSSRRRWSWAGLDRGSGPRLPYRSLWDVKGGCHVSL